MSKETIQNYTEKIKVYEKDIKDNYINIARCLNEIKIYNYVSGTEYKNVYDYALNEFGYEKTKTVYLISVYEKFFADEVRQHVAFSNLKYGKYSITQLRYMQNFTDEKLNQCDPDMSVRKIKEINCNLVTRVTSIDVEKSDILKNQNVITGVFPEKKEEKTIIVSEMPKMQVQETTTVITETSVTQQNDDFVTSSPEDFYIKKLTDLQEENIKFQVKIKNFENKVSDYEYQIEQKIDVIKENFSVLNYVYNQLSNLNIKATENIKDEIYHYTAEGKLPNKLNFIQNVI
ncbi:MAG: hypothetical protein SA378_11220 [Sedimentibacter sp.]|uniref:hypothetical protein n=1 Tax=Sedimentibacter sp. TaxID=1960295 RepID=UPI0029822259|nr:hypothetical protein [Sedimentibacter sp.]MDW5300685.1 hypothetical protein [Sedimentibacter sp.]